MLVGYERAQMIEDDSNYKLSIVQVRYGCAPLPKTFARNAVAKHVLAVREGKDHGAMPGHVDQTTLTRQTRYQFRRAGSIVIVLNMLDDKGRQSSGPRYPRAVLLLHRHFLGDRI